MPPPLVSWRVTDLPDVALVRRRIDPFVQLKLAGVEPLASTAAHWENELDLAYLDPDDVLCTYAGPADCFDWSQVARVFAQTWTDSPAPVDGLSGTADDLSIEDLLKGDSAASKAKGVLCAPSEFDQQNFRDHTDFVLHLLKSRSFVDARPAHLVRIR